MEGVPQQRVRGGRRGRGVRVMLARGGGPPVEGAGAVAGPSRRGRGRGSRGGRANVRHERPGPQTIDELSVRDIMELPEGHGLETPLHAKRMRVWQPSNPAAVVVPQPPAPPSPASCAVPSPAMFVECSGGTSAPPSPAPPSPASCAVPSPAMFVECSVGTSAPPSPAPPSPASCAVPSPAMFVECSGWLEVSPQPASPMQHLPPPPRPSHQYLRDEDISNFLNYGSDAGSDESGDEEPELVIPRACQSTMETPLDEDEDEDADAADIPVTAGVTAPAGVPAPAINLVYETVPPLATDQPWSLYDFQWTEFPNASNSSDLRRETFSQNNVGPTTPRDDPYDIFIDIWDRQFMEHIALETNRYAQQVKEQMSLNHRLQPKSRIGKWIDTTADELYIYYAILLSMGMVVKSRLDEYWSATPDILYTPGFSAYMSINRFILINKCLHFVNNEDMRAPELGVSEARLFKIQPLLSHLNRKFQHLYTPGQNIALDESLLMWKGWLDIGQLIPNKAANKGVKTYEICESQTGYLWRFEIHSHKKNSTPSQQLVDPLDASTPSIVLRLTQGLEHNGYTLWMDNFYNSPCLARRLKCLGFDCVGTLRTDRKFVPQALHSLTKQNMRKGQVAALTSGDVDVMVWRDKNRIAMISTYHGNAQSTVRGSTKPTLILDYNIMMGGVDKKDQLLSMFPVERKRTKVWYKKVFRRLLNVSVLNSFIIYRHNHHSASSLNHRNFRIQLIKSLLSKHASPASLPPASLPPATTPNVQPDLRHRLDYLGMGPSQPNRRKCRGCQKQTRTFCVGCGKTSCIPCFVQVHSSS